MIRDLTHMANQFEMPQDVSDLMWKEVKAENDGKVSSEMQQVLAKMLKDMPLRLDDIDKMMEGELFPYFEKLLGPECGIRKGYAKTSRPEYEKMIEEILALAADGNAIDARRRIDALFKSVWAARDTYMAYKLCQDDFDVAIVNVGRWHADKTMLLRELLKKAKVKVSESSTAWSIPVDDTYEPH